MEWKKFVWSDHAWENRHKKSTRSYTKAGEFMVYFKAIHTTKCIYRLYCHYKFFTQNFFFLKIVSYLSYNKRRPRINGVFQADFSEPSSNCRRRWPRMRKGGNSGHAIVGRTVILITMHDLSPVPPTWLHKLWFRITAVWVFLPVKLMMKGKEKETNL